MDEMGFVGELTADGSHQAARRLSLPDSLSSPVTASGVPRLSHLVKLDASTNCLRWHDLLGIPPNDAFQVCVSVRVLLVSPDSLRIPMAGGHRRGSSCLHFQPDLGWIFLTCVLPLMRRNRLVFYGELSIPIYWVSSYVFGISIVCMPCFALSFLVFLSRCLPIVLLLAACCIAVSCMVITAVCGL
jgi:hypothetical protein